MSLNFLKTKVGVSLVLAVIFITGAGVFRTSQKPLGNNLQNKIGLIADASVQNGIKNGDIVPTDWENSLKINSPKNFGGVANLTGTSTESSTTEENLTATDRFSREFFTQYVNLKKSGSPIDENTGTNLVNKLLIQDYGSQTEEKTYTEKDIYIQTTTIELVKKYSNALGEIISDPLPKNYEPELVIVARVNDGGNEDDLKKLNMNIERYQTLRNKISLLPVPKDLKNVHLAIINSLSSILEGVRGMTLIETDPVGATKMIALYQDGISSISIPFEALRVYLSKQKILFSPNEAGYVLTQ